MKNQLKVPYFTQHTVYTCGPASLKMVFGFFGLKTTEKKLVKKSKTTYQKGAMHSALIDLARKNGFYCYVHENSSIHQIKHFIHRNLPIIINYTEPADNEGHYAVVIGYKRNKLILNDPWNGRKFMLPQKKFERRWHDAHKNYKCEKWLMVLSRKKFNIGKQYSPK